jgi:GWxTD domain-containing protein
LALTELGGGEPLVCNGVEFMSRRGWCVCLWALFSVFTALGLVLPVSNAAPQEGEKLSKAEKRRQKAIQKELESPYKKWLSEEVPYIITGEERAAFKKLSTDDEREQFIENFWERRNPNPGSPENEFKEEYYRRIAYANEHYASGIPGWKTDRGRIYIM